MVGHPSRDYLWILSRTPTLPDEIYEMLVDQAREKGYPVENLRRTDQACF
jgi:apolipoprotein D and lipocalin family protein